MKFLDGREVELRNAKQKGFSTVGSPVWWRAPSTLATMACLAVLLPASLVGIGYSIYSITKWALT